MMSEAKTEAAKTCFTAPPCPGAKWKFAAEQITDTGSELSAATLAHAVALR
jgi:hypothetical protein